MEISQAIQALGSEIVAERQAAAEMLAKSGTVARAAAVGLCRAANDTDETVREWANAALEEMGPPPSAEKESLAELLEAPEGTAYWAVTLLGRLEGEAHSISAKLAALVQYEATPAEVRNRALWSLEKIGSRTPEVKQAAEAAAKSENPRTARLAAKLLAQM